MPVTTVSDPRAIRDLKSRIEDLASHAVSENVFYEEWMLAPALEFLPASGVRIALVWSKDGKSLDGLFPLQSRTGYRRLPIRFDASWKHLHCFLGTPLVREGAEEGTLVSFLEWLSRNGSGRMIVLFGEIPADGHLCGAIRSVAAARRLTVDIVDSYSRPLLVPGDGGADKYLETSLSAKHRKDLRKKRAKLENLGKVEFTSPVCSEELSGWIDRFLGLESSGWKGRDNTAMGGIPGERSFFEAVVREAFGQGRLCLHALTLNGQAIAMRCGFRGNKGIFSFKIAFDERYEKYSPGALLEVEYLGAVFDDRNVSWVDSCAMPGDNSLSRLWREERTILTVAMSLESAAGRMLVSAMEHLTAARSAFRECWQSAYLRGRSVLHLT